MEKNIIIFVVSKNNTQNKCVCVYLCGSEWQIAATVTRDTYTQVRCMCVFVCRYVWINVKTTLLNFLEFNQQIFCP